MDLASSVPQGDLELFAKQTLRGSHTAHASLSAYAMDADGDFVVTWGNSFGGIFARTYSRDGQPGQLIQVSTGQDYWSSVAMDADGDFVVTWSSLGQDGSFNGIYAQRYSAAGVPQGAEFRVNTYTTDTQRVPAVGMDASGDFVIAFYNPVSLRRRTQLAAAKEILAQNEDLPKQLLGSLKVGGLVLEVPEKVLGAITRRDNPQMVAAVFEQRFARLGEIRPAEGEVWVALDRVRDPGNLGTIIRTVDAVGAKGVILVGDTTDPYSLEAVRATMGSLFSVPLARAREDEFLTWRKTTGALFVGTHLEGAVDYRTQDYGSGPVVLVMGNEQQGLPPSLAEACDALVRIPQAGRADSLNLSVATGVMLYEIRRNGLPGIGDNRDTA